MLRKRFVHNGLQIEYGEFGKGKSVVLALHGFGREAEDFRKFVPMLREDERIVAINLSLIRKAAGLKADHCLKAFLHKNTKR